MKPILFAIVCLSAAIAGAQPFPLPQDAPPGSSVTTYGPQDQQFTTFKTPTGWVSYGPSGERYDSFPTYTGGVVTYGSGNEKWESTLSPASAFPPKRTRR